MRAPPASSDATSADDAEGLRVMIVAARYHRAITDQLIEGARSSFIARGGRNDDLSVIEAPGAYELPLLCREAARRGDTHAVVALGCIIRGETPHDLIIGHAIAAELLRVQAETGTPIAFGVLTCLTVAQAEDRAGGRHGNKGEEAMNAALDTRLAMQNLRSGNISKSKAGD